jgi:hypothetical protein
MNGAHAAADAGDPARPPGDRCATPARDAVAPPDAGHDGDHEDDAADDVVTAAEQQDFDDLMAIAAHRELARGSWWFRGGRLTPLACVVFLVVPGTALFMALPHTDFWLPAFKGMGTAAVTYALWYGMLLWPAARAARAAERRRAARAGETP